MRICFIHPAELEGSGAARFLWNLAALCRDDFEVHVLVKKEHITDSFVPPLNVMIHPVKSDEQGASKIAELKPHIIHHNGPRYGWLVKAMGDIPKIGTEHGWAAHLKPKFDWVMPIIPGPGPSIRHGVDLDLFSPITKPVDLDPLMVGIVGRVDPLKYPDKFIQALHHLDKVDRDIQITGVGPQFPGANNQRTRDLLDKVTNLILIDDVPYVDMPAFYHSLDILLVPSSTESVSYAAIEALACGVPVLYNKVDGLPATVGEAGYACDSPIDMIRQIQILNKNRKMIKSLQKIARRRARENFDIERMYQEYKAEYLVRVK